RTARKLGEQQQQVAGEASKLWEGADAANAQQRAERVQSLTEKKGQMADQVRDLKSRLDRMSLDSRRENREASTGLADASKAMRDRKLEEKIRASQGSLRFGGPEYSRALEGTIGNDLADLQQRLEQVASAARNGKPSDNATQSEALDRARQLVRGVASLDERMRQQRSQNAGEQPAQGQ